MKKMMNFLYGCLSSNQGTLRRLGALNTGEPAMWGQKTPTALVINTLQSGAGVRKFLSDYDLISARDFQHLLGFFENYKIPIFLVIEDIYSNAYQLRANSDINKIHALLLTDKIRQRLPKVNGSAFAGTDLDKELNQLGIRKIIFTGQMTETAQNSTRRDAELLGYQAVFTKNLAAGNGKLTKAKYPVDGAKGLIQTLSEINRL